jgi:hypothetical protein
MGGGRVNAGGASCRRRFFVSIINLSSMGARALLRSVRKSALGRRKTIAAGFM